MYGTEFTAEYELPFLASINPDELKRPMQGSPVNAVCGPFDKPIPPSMFEASGVPSTSAVKLPLCGALKAEVPHSGPFTDTRIGEGGPAATAVCAVKNRHSPKG